MDRDVMSGAGCGRRPVRYSIHPKKVAEKIRPEMAITVQMTIAPPKWICRLGSISTGTRGEGVGDGIAPIISGGR
jgi:hypothetical protein